MIPLQAEISTNAGARDGRRATRRTLRLEVQALSATDATKALIHDLSERGLLIETTASIKVGDTLQVELPDTGTIDARIVWARASYLGCEFVSPISKAVVSSALLRSPIEPSTRWAPSEVASKSPRVEYGYPAEATANKTALGLSLVLLLAVVGFFLLALASFSHSL